MKLVNHIGLGQLGPWLKMSNLQLNHNNLLFLVSEIDMHNEDSWQSQNTYVAVLTGWGQMVGADKSLMEIDWIVTGSGLLVVQ